MPISKGGALLLNTLKDELFPELRKLKDLLVRLQKIRTGFTIYSSELNSIEKDYAKVSENFFAVVRKLQTPDVLFESLESKDEPQHIADYFRFNEAMNRSIGGGLNDIEIIDRTLDRKSQNVQHTRTFLLSIVALLLAVWH